MNADFSDDVIQRVIADQAHAFDARSGELYLADKVVYCKPSANGWVVDPDRPAEPVPFTPRAPVEFARLKPRLRMVPVPGDRTDFLLVLDRADGELADVIRNAIAPVPDIDRPKLLREQIVGCAGVLAFEAEIEVE